MTSVQLKQLEVFHAILETGSVTGAAKALHVTQPAVSVVLRNFEARIKVKLFERVGRRLQPTPEALALMPDVMEIFGRVRTLNRATEAMRAGLVGKLMVAGSPTLVDSLLPRAVVRFRNANPGVTILLRTLHTPMVVEAVARKAIDVGVIYGPVDHPGVESEELMRSQIACVLPPRHPLADKDTLGPADLLGQPLISLERGSTIGNSGREIARHFEAAGVPEPHPVIEFSSTSTACMLVREGGGIGLVDRVAAMSGAVSDLTFRPFHPTVPLRVQLIFPRNRPRSQPAVGLADALRALVAEVQRGMPAH